MGLRDVLLRRRGTKALGQVTASPVLLDALRLFDGSLASYGTVYRRLGPVRAVVDFLADAVSTTPLKVYRRAASGRPEVRDHPLAELLRHPNDDLTPRQMLFGTVADLAIYGNAYWRKVEQGRTRWIVPLPPFRVTPKGGDLLAPRTYDLWDATGAPPISLSRDEVVHFKLYDPEDRRVGSSKLEALRNVLQEEVEASRNRAGFWQNSARISGWIERDVEAGSLTLAQAQIIRDSLTEQHAGAANAGKMGVLPEGTHAKAGQFSPSEAEFVEGRRFVLEATAHVFNLPLSLLSLTDSATYASARQFHSQLYTDVLPPWYENIQSTIELDLVPWFSDADDLYVEHVVEAKLRGDFLDQIETFSKALGGGSTPGFMLIEEVRDMFNLPALDDPRAGELIVPLNVSLGPEPAPVAPVAAVPTPATSRAAALAGYFDRQERVLRSRLGAGRSAYDLERWNRELERELEAVGVNGDSRTLAEKVNLETYLELQDGEPAEVFARAKTYRAAAIAASIPDRPVELATAPAAPALAMPELHIHLAEERDPPVVYVKNETPAISLPDVSVPVTVQVPAAEAPYVTVPVEVSVPPAEAPRVMVPIEVSVPPAEAPRVEVPVEVHLPEAAPPEIRVDVASATPDVVVNVPETRVEVASPDVVVNVPETRVEVASAPPPDVVVHVPETRVSVAPEIRVEPAEVTVVQAPTPRRRTVKTPIRDPETGEIVRVVEEDVE